VVIAMKHYLTISCIILVQFSFGQKSSDTCITEKQLYALKYRIALLANENITKHFQLRLLTELNHMDTVHNSTDSLVIKYISKTGKVIRTQKKYLKNGCTRDSLLIHYNRNELTGYMENWHSSICDADTTDKENTYFIYKNTYSRYEYDTLKRVSKYVFHISTPMTRRVLISYNAEQKAIRTVMTIKEEEFWD
jgi:hypothetical protein